MPTKRWRNTPMRLPFKRGRRRGPRRTIREMCGGLRGDRILRVRAGHEIERERDVAHRLRHRPDRVVVGVERHHAGAAGQPARRADRRQRRERRRVRQRVARVGAEAERRQAGRHGRGAAAARSGGAERRIVGVADGAADAC